MKKLILIIPVLLTLPSYADIASGASSATCDNSTIGATEGSTDLEANWNANSITVNWYNGNTKITTNTCSYDGAVTIPATPTKAGYTFNGWHVRVAAKQCWEIEDETECEATQGCVMSAQMGDCRRSVTSCNTITNETECNHATAEAMLSICEWNLSGECVHRMWTGGGN